MCGIIAYTGKRQAAGILYEGLTRLEYRGYDSAGIALSGGQRICCVKRAGRVSAIADALTMPGNCGIGHTRWRPTAGRKIKMPTPMSAVNLPSCTTASSKIICA